MIQNLSGRYSNKNVVQKDNHSIEDRIKESLKNFPSVKYHEKIHTISSQYDYTIRDQSILNHFLCINKKTELLISLRNFYQNI